jgi:hypothetical protein
MISAGPTAVITKREGMMSDEKTGQRSLLDELDKADPPTPLAYTQQMEVFRTVLAMRDHLCPEWERFVEMVKVYISESSRARTGVPYGWKRAEQALRPISEILSEWNEQRSMPQINFAPLADEGNP